MDQATLVGQDLNAGSEAIGALEAAQIKPVVALLMASPESEDWRLVLSSPALDQTHRLKAYEQVAEVLHDRSSTLCLPFSFCPQKIPS